MNSSMLAKEKGSRWRVSISFLFASMFSVILMALVLLSYEEFGQIKRVKVLTEDIYTDTLPDLIDNQKMLINVQHLRHVGQLSYYSDDPFIRRNSRMKARIIVGDSSFSTIRGLRTAGSLIIESIDDLARIRTSIDSLENILIAKSVQYLFIADEIFGRIKADSEHTELFKVVGLYIKNARVSLKFQEYDIVYSTLKEHFIMLKRSAENTVHSREFLDQKIAEGESLLTEISSMTSKMRHLVLELDKAWSEVDSRASVLNHMIRSG
ncbi:MAG: hypothetical protein LBK52_02645, partial [Deltaproteobacteria bacterium]|nr:hypothetical protein [Deltaproteobacteria bacterium]